jgi:hypothetical protein
MMGPFQMFHRYAPFQRFHADRSMFKTFNRYASFKPFKALEDEDLESERQELIRRCEIA